MSEEIKKNEINEDELESVSGGANEDFLYDARPCPLCGKHCLPKGDGTGYVCADCWIQFF